MDSHQGIQGLTYRPLFDPADIQRAMRQLSLREAVGGLTYKPNVTFAVEGEHHLVIKASVPDADDPERYIPVVGMWPFPEGTDPIQHIVRTIKKFEDHEMWEWLRFGGLRLHPPHGGQI